jgi:hypothetical protein
MHAAHRVPTHRYPQPPHQAGRSNQQVQHTIHHSEPATAGWLLQMNHCQTVHKKFHEHKIRFTPSTCNTNMQTPQIPHSYQDVKPQPFIRISVHTLPPSRLHNLHYSWHSSFLTLLLLQRAWPCTGPAEPVARVRACSLHAAAATWCWLAQPTVLQLMAQLQLHGQTAFTAAASVSRCCPNMQQYCLHPRAHDPLGSTCLGWLPHSLA